MIQLHDAVGKVLDAQTASNKPLAIMLAGHNGSGKSTMWTQRLSPVIQIPLVNADRMMMSVLPDVRQDALPKWAVRLRDENTSWMKVAQKGVEAFVAQAMIHGVPFAMETVFSDWREQPDGVVFSKIDRVREMQAAGYFVLLLFVGLSDAQLSIGRVMTRTAQGGHAVDHERVLSRFPRTQKAIRHALDVADASILVDNSREEKQAFTVCRVQLDGEGVFDIRDVVQPVPAAISAWLDVVAPR